MKDFPKINTKTLFKLLESKDVCLVDVRPVNAYNGWRLQGEARGGHIPGARSLPSIWANYIDWIEMVRNKQIWPEQQVVLYGYSEKQMEEVALRFQNAGYKKCSIYPDFLDEWVPNNLMPLERMERYQHLVHPQWVQAIVKGETPPEHPGGKTVICHAHYRNRDAYLSGHIPGAIDINTNDLESTETWNRLSPAQLKATLEKHGITSDTTVVLYGKYMDPDNDHEFPGSAAGDIGAIRCAFIMMYAGVKDVRVLNGGFHAWQRAGFEIHTDDVPKSPVSDFGTTIPAQPQLAVDMEEAKNMLASDEADLVCVRSLPEYLGEVSGYNYIEAKGRIPGAVFVDCGSDAYHMENYRNLDYTTREYPEIEAIWRAAGLIPQKHLAFYCGTGWRGSEAWFNAWLLGWPRVSVFDGGWFEWSNDPSNPYETGEPEG